MFRGTTIVAIKKGNNVALAGDGQVTFGGNTIMKHKAKKVRRLYNGQVIAGFAGSVADAITLFEKFEGKLEEYRGNMQRAAVELAKEWRLDKVLRKLEALMIVANQESILVISGNGEVLEPDDNVTAIGSGGSYALAAARALDQYSNLPPREAVVAAMKIAASICVYTNDQIIVEEI